MGGIEFIEWLNAPQRILAMYVPIYFLWLPDFESFRYEKNTNFEFTVQLCSVCISIPMQTSNIHKNYKMAKCIGTFRYEMKIHSQPLSLEHDINLVWYIGTWVWCLKSGMTRSSQKVLCGCTQASKRIKFLPLRNQGFEICPLWEVIIEQINDKHT